MKLLFLAGMLVAIAAVAVGMALGGFLGLFVTGSAGILGVLLAGRLLAPASPVGTARSSAADERVFLGRLVLGGFALRAFASLLLHETGWWEYMGSDEDTFDGNGQGFVLWVQGLSPHPYSVRFRGSFEVAYFCVVGGMYYTFGIAKFFPLFVNCVVGVCTAYPVHALAGAFAGRAAARRAAVLVVFFPSLVLWSSLMVRDAMALALLATSLLLAYRLRRRFSAAQLLGLLVCLGALATLRTYIFLIVAVAISVALVVGQRSVGRAIFTGGFVMVALVLTMQTTGLGQSELERANLDTLALHRQYNAMGPTIAGSLGADVDISTPTRALTYLPLGLVYFYCSPFPWQIGSPRQVMALVDLLLWYSIMPAMAFGMLWLLRRRFRAVLPLLLTVIGISVLYALVEGNIGIIFRHRAQIIVPLCAVAGVGYALKRRRARKESLLLEGPVPLHAPAGGPLRPAPGVRLYPRAP